MDLSMILGVAHDPFASAPPAFIAPPSPAEEEEEPAKPPKKRKKEREAAEQAEAGDADEAAAAKRERKRLRREARARDELARAAAAAAEAEADDGEPPAPGWWGAAVFRWAGRLGSIQSSKKERGFCEDDQVAAFNAVNDGKAEGRGGLGIKDAPRKVAGVRFSGKKTALGGADD